MLGLVAWARGSAFLLFLFGVTLAQSAEQRCDTGTFWSELAEKCFLPYKAEDPDAFDKPMSFTMRQVSIRPEMTWIAAEGVIVPDTPVVFRKFLEENLVYTENRIEFNSPGGNLFAAMELGRIIRERGNATTIGRSLTLANPEMSMDVIHRSGAICYSACAYAFIGGSSRSLGGGLLGVHRFGSNSFSVSGDIAQIVSSEVAAYIAEMGVDQRLLQIASRTSFENDIFSISEELAAELRISFDPDDRASRFDVAMLGQDIVANAILFHKGFEYNVRLRCINREPQLVVWGRQDQFPDIFHDLPQALALLKSGGAEIYVPITAGTLNNGNTFITATSREIPSAILHNGEISLDMVWTEDWDGFELLERIRWTDRVTWFKFHLRIDNAPETVPIITRECNR